MSNQITLLWKKMEYSNNFNTFKLAIFHEHHFLYRIVSSSSSSSVSPFFFFAIFHKTLIIRISRVENVRNRQKLATRRLEALPVDD